MSAPNLNRPNKFSPAGISLLLSLISYQTYWVGLTVFIFPPLAFYFGFRFYSGQSKSEKSLNLTQKFIQASPMIIAFGCFIFELSAINSGKWT